jgi:hypothetical protein
MEAEVIRSDLLGLPRMSCPVVVALEFLPPPPHTPMPALYHPILQCLPYTPPNPPYTSPTPPTP